NESLDAATEKRVENHCRNTYRQTTAGVDQRFDDSFGKKSITSGAQISAERGKRSNDTDGGAEQSDQRRNHSDLGQICDSIIQVRCDPRSFCFREITNLLKIGIWIFGRK